jgi:hypothetical protein
MRFQRQLLIALATTVVAACAKDVKGVSNVGDIPPLAYVRYLNAVSDTLGTDVRSIDHLTYATPFLATPYRAMGYGGYQGYAAGSHKIRVFPNSTNIAVTSSWFVDTTLTFAANTYYTIVHVGLGSGTGTAKQGLVVLADTFPAQSTSAISYRVWNVGNDLGAVDVYATAATTDALPGTATFANVAYKARSAYVSRTAGPLALRVYPAGTTTTPTIAATLMTAGTAGTTSADPIGGSSVAGTIATAMIYSKTLCTTTAACATKGITLVAAPSIVWWNDLQPPRTTSP